MTETDRDVRRTFLIDTFESHVAHIRTGQSRRFEILRYTFAGFFAYFAFLLSIEDKRFLCTFPFETTVLIPAFLLIQVFLYIWIVNWNIGKHGRYIQYLFDNGLTGLGVGPNLYQAFLAEEMPRRNPLVRWMLRWHLHTSQVVLLVLIGGCGVLYLYLDAMGEITQVVTCPG